MRYDYCFGEEPLAGAKPHEIAAMTRDPQPADPQPEREALPDPLPADAQAEHEELLPDPVDFKLFAGALGALAGLFVLLYGINYGPGLDYDSMQYVSVARSLQEGEGFVNAKGNPQTLWPPLYPLALTVTAELMGGIDPRDVAGPLNAVLFALTIFAAGCWLRLRLESHFLAVWASFAIALAIPLVEASSWMLSEPLFILLTVLALIETDKFLAEGRTRSLVGAAAFAALAWQTRYIGVVVPLFAAAALLCRRAVPLPRRVRDAAAVALPAALLMAPWLLRVFLISGTLTGRRDEFDFPLHRALLQTAEALRGWAHFDLPPIGGPPADLLSFAGVVWAAAAVAAAALIAPAAFAFLKAQWQERRLADWRPLCLFGGFALTYLALLLAVIVSGNAFFRVLPRYLAPLYIPLIAVAAFALDRFFAQEREKTDGRASVAALAAMTLLCLWTAGQVMPNIRRIVLKNKGELLEESYAGPRWADSETLAYIRERPLNGTVYGNRLTLLTAFHNPGDAVYRNLEMSEEAGGAETADAPWRRRLSPQESLEAQFAAAPQDAWLVWLKEDGDEDEDGDGLPESIALELIDELDDGAVYRIDSEIVQRVNRARVAGEAVAAGDFGDPEASGVFDVYRRGGELIYLKEPCAQEDVQVRFFLHVWPADAADLPAARREGGYSFENLDFDFSDYGVVEEGRCIAVRGLPGYAAATIGTGQYASGETIWRAELRPAPVGAAVESGE